MLRIKVLSKYTNTSCMFLIWLLTSFQLVILIRKEVLSIFKNSKCKIVNIQNQLVMQGSLYTKGIYRLDEAQNQCIDRQPRKGMAFAATTESLDLWLRRMSHMNSQYLHQLERRCPTVRLSPETLGQCEPCAHWPRVPKGLIARSWIKLAACYRRQALVMSFGQKLSPQPRTLPTVHHILQYK